MKAELIRQLFQPFKTRLANILTRSKTVSVDSSQPVFIVLSMVRGKPSPENIPMMQHFGFASVPPKDADQVRAHLSSDPDNPLIIASLDQVSQPTDLLEGDAALFDNRSQFIKIQVDGIHIISPNKNINIKTTGANVNIETDKTVNINAAETVNANTPDANFSGNGTFQGTLKAAKFENLAGLVIDDHVHVENNVLGGPTNEPKNP